MATPGEEVTKNLSWRRYEDGDTQWDDWTDNIFQASWSRRYEDGDTQWDDWTDNIFQASWSHKCPTYVHETPPCQGSCPSGHDVRGWLAIVRGQEKPAEGTEWQQYAFERATDSNPFPSMM